ncbi:MAG: hypothetical protein ACLGP3_02170 [Acidobacteriota bacterium]
MQAVGKFCAQGRISFSLKNGKRWFPDLQAAAREYLASRDVGRGQRRANEAASDGDGAAPPVAVPDDEQIESYQKSAARLQHYKAALAEIEFQIQTGTLVRKDEFEREVFKFHRNLRDQLLNVPDRTAALLAAETEQVKVHAILTREIRRVLSALADEAETAG